MSVTVLMHRADGTADSEVHFEGHIAKPDETGVVRIPAEFVLSMMMAGYVHTATNAQNKKDTAI
jgi:hypothetical protein